MLIRTIRCKMTITQETEQAFLETRETFAKACNLVLAKALETKTRNAVALHRLTYAEIRKECHLSANLAVRAIRRVAGSLSQKKKRRPKPNQFRPGSIEYDARIFTFWEAGFRVSLMTLQGRKKALLDVGEYQKKALKGQKPTCATLVKRGNEWYLNIAIEEPEPPLVEGIAIGIDLGLRNTAYVSTGFYASGQDRQAFKKRREKIRASLQSKGTRGSRKKLRTLSGYERRRIRHDNHNLSKQLVQEAQRHNAGLIRMEQLSGIRERTLVWNPHRNRLMSGWSFYQLQQLVTYKARRVGIAVELVDPAYTSRVCFECGQQGLRSKDVFQCIACGEKHADHNAACNISIGGAVVNRPKLTVCV
jgi:IS605 OrfB family transposase